MMKLLVDDERPRLPDGSRPDIIFTNFGAATFFLEMEMEHLSDYELYVDHDLGESKTGYDLVTAIEWKHFKHGYALPKSIVCVSDNGPGRARIEQVVQKLYGRLFYG